MNKARRGVGAGILDRSRAADEVYAAALEHFNEADLVRLTVAVGAINLWNRIGVAFRLQHPRGMDARLPA